MDLSLYCPSNRLYDQESMSKYKPGGYHPVSLGDTFADDRYEVYHKLGWGGFSTVWLAKDRVRNQWVSLKIMTADSSTSQELGILKFLEEKSEGGLSSNYIVQLLDSFHHEGPNGIHQCLVLELLGPSIAQLLSSYPYEDEPLEPEVVLRISTQLLKAVKFIHSIGMCHGDINGGNIAFACTQALQEPEDILDIIGLPETEPLERKDGTPLEDGLPAQLIKAAEWVEWVYEDEEDIRLLDFGESFYHGQQPQDLAQPSSLRIPEEMFTDCFDYRLDLWRAGNMIYFFLFKGYPFWYFTTQEDYISQMIGFVEPLPAEWESKWKSMVANSNFDEEANSSFDEEPEEDSGTTELERTFIKWPPDPTLHSLLPVIQGLMRFLPSGRLTAEEALGLLGKAQYQWVNEVKRLSISEENS